MDVILSLETLPQQPGKFLPSLGVTIAAGMASSAATAAARLGGQVSLWASVGDDPVGPQLIAGIRAEGVDCSLVRRVKGGASAVAACLLDARGERVIVPWYDPVTYGDPGTLPTDEIANFNAVLCDTRWPAAAALALQAARSSGNAAILDADVAPPEVLDRLMPLASVIVASREGALVATSSHHSPMSAAQALASRFGVPVVVTDGSAGCHFCDNRGTTHHVPAPRVAVVDTVAAGDVFHGAFTLAMAEGHEMLDAISFASAAAALKCRRFGGRLGAPTRAELSAFLQEQEA